LVYTQKALSLRYEQFNRKDMSTAEGSNRTLGLPRTIEEVMADIAIAEAEHLQGLGYTTEDVFEKLPWTMTLEEKKESIRQAEEDYKAGRLRTTEEVFAKYL
jgi:hypothetical protein